MEFTTDQWINISIAVGTFVSGAGTLAAVIVALRIARRPGPVELEVSMSASDRTSQQGEPLINLYIYITNIGVNTAVLRYMTWLIGRWPRKSYIPLLPWDEPAQLPYGKSCTVGTSIGQKSPPNFKEVLAFRHLKGKKLSTLRLRITTVSGQNAILTPPQDVLSKLENAMAENGMSS